MTEKTIVALLFVAAGFCAPAVVHNSQQGSPPAAVSTTTAGHR